MEYWSYLKSRMAPFLTFCPVMALVLWTSHGEFWAAVVAALLALAFFASVFSTLWLLGTVVRRKPRRELFGLRAPRR